MKLTHIMRFPVKSLGGNALNQSPVTPQGLPHDRTWLIATTQGEMITARKYPQLLLWQTQIDAVSGSLNVHFGDGTFLRTSPDAHQQTQQVTVWKDTFTAYCGDDVADALLSAQLGFAVRLYYLGVHSHRRVRDAVDTPLSFADGAPFLLTNLASLHDLNAQLNENFEMTRFRANLVISGSEPYAEESWQRIQIGDVVFRIMKPCVRCVMPTLNLHNAQAHPQRQPLTYLAQQRNAIFGVNLLAENVGEIAVGDTVRVLAHHSSTQ